MKIRKRFLIAALFLLLVGMVPALLSSAATFALRIPALQRFVQDRVQALVDPLLAGRFTISGITTDLLSGIHIERATVANVGQKTDSMVVRDVTARFRLVDLLRRRVTIHSITIDSAYTGFVASTNGLIELPFLPAKDRPRRPRSDTASSWHVSLGIVKIRNLRSSLIDSTRELFSTIDRGTAQARFHRLDSLTVTLAVSAGTLQSPYWNGMADSLRTTVTITGKALDVALLRLKGMGTALHCRATIPYSLKGFWSCRGEVQTPVAPLTPLVRMIVDTNSGTIASKFAFVMNNRRPFFTLETKGYGLEAAGIPLDTVSVRGSFCDDTLEAVCGIAAPSLSGNANLTCLVRNLIGRPSIQTYNAQVNVDRAELTLLSRFFPANAYTAGAVASVAGHIRGVGIALPEESVINGSVEGGIFESIPAKVRASMSNDSLRVALGWGRNTVEGNGLLAKPDGIRGTFRAVLNQPELLSTLLLKERITGALQLQGRIEGKVQNPQISASLQADRIGWNDLRVTQPRIAVEYRNKVLTIKDSRLQLDGDITPALRIAGIDSAGGVVSVAVEGEGTLASPIVRARFSPSDLFYKQLSATILGGLVAFRGPDHLSWRELVVRQSTTSITSNGSASLQRQKKASASLRIRTLKNETWHDAGALQIDGTVSKDSLRAKIDIGRFPLNVLQSFVAFDSTVGGDVEGVVTVDGAFKNIGAAAQLTIKNPQYGRYRGERIELNATLMDSLVIAQSNLRVRNGGLPIIAAARLPVSPGNKWSIVSSELRPMNLTVRGRSINVGAFASFLPPGMKATGLVVVDISAEKSQGEWTISGETTIKKGSVAYQPIQLQAEAITLDAVVAGSLMRPDAAIQLKTGLMTLASQKISSTIWNGRLSGDTLALDSGYAAFAEGGMLRVSGSLPLRSLDSLLDQKQQLVLELSQMPFRALGTFVTGMEIRRGILDGSAILVFKKGKLQSFGELSLRDGFIAIEELEPGIGPINGTFVLNGDHCSIKQFKALVGKGVAELTGSVSLTPEGGLNPALQLQVKNLAWRLTEMGTFSIESGRIAFSSELGRYVVSGKLNLGETTITRDFQVTDLISVRPQRGPLMVQKRSLLDDIRLDVELLLGQNLFIDMNLGNLQMDGRLMFSQTAAKPGIIGEISVVQGYLNYLDREFAIRTGSVWLYNPYTVNPSIDLTASTDIVGFNDVDNTSESYRIQLSVSGDLQKPTFVLTSQPELDQRNIISVLTFGTTIEGVGTDAASRIGSLVGRELLGFGTRRLEKILGLQSITISGNLLDRQDTLSLPQITLTKRVSQRLLFTYGTEFTNLKKQKVSAMYRIFPFLFLTGETDGEGDTRVKLKFKFSK